MDNNVKGKTVHCRTCERAVEIPEPAQGHPYGWYSVSVSVPPWLNADSGKAYRWVGMFCSPSCLTAHNIELTAQEALMREAYEPE
jgi:uncharacterized protein CbrC (UPF0167 family)